MLNVQISSLPTVIAFKDGKVKNKFGMSNNTLKGLEADGRSWIQGRSRSEEVLVDAMMHPCTVI